jgi:hypothetical protein
MELLLPVLVTHAQAKIGDIERQATNGVIWYMMFRRVTEVYEHV